MAVLGLAPLEERLYRTLLAEGPSSRTKLSKLVGTPAPTVTRALAALQVKGLIGQSAHRSPLIAAIPPKIAIEALLTLKREELEKAGALARNLMEEFRNIAAERSPSGSVEIVAGAEAIVQRAGQLQLAARREVLIFDTPPYLGQTGLEPIEVDLLARGIGYRVVYDRVALEWPGQLDQIQGIVALGEQARVIDHLPMKLAFADDDLAMVPVSPAESPDREPQRLMVHPSPLLDGLLSLFNMIWERAAPVRGPLRNLPVPVEGDSALTAEDERLLMLLVADLKDEAIGRQLGITRRTVNRRIRKLMEAHKASSRLQLLLDFARKGLI